MVIHEPVQAAIWHALNHYAYADAIFLAERLYAEVGSDEALFLLATCYYRSGKSIRAYSFLKGKGCPTPQCKYLMAKCCLDINKLSEAESVIVGNVFVKSHTQDDIINEFGEMSSYTLSLLGDIYRRTDRFSKAAEHYKRSLKLNPFHWSSFESLCQIGEKPDPTKVFQVTSNESISVCQSNHPGMEVNNLINTSQHITGSGIIPTDGALDVTPITHLSPVTVAQTPDNAGSAPATVNVESSPALFQTPDLQPTIQTHLNFGTMAPSRNKRVIPRGAGRSLLGGVASLSPLTPSFGVLPFSLDTPTQGDTHISMPSFITPSTPAALIDPDPKAPIKKPMTRRSQQTTAKPPVFSQSGNTNTRDVTTPSPQASLQSNVPVVRRSSRLYSSANSVKENNKSQSTKTRFASPRVPSKKSKSKLSKSQQELNEINKLEATPDTKPATIASAQAQMVQMQKQSAVGLMALLRDIGKAYLCLAQYDCKKAVQLLSELPPQHYNTGWVLCHIGRAFFEVAEYKKAEKLFSEVRHLEPYHFAGMEIYSTTLWQLEKEMELSALAQELVDFDKESPEAWCATGNCFSLQKEHDTAIKFFHRAIQVDPHFAYAYNLLGHEYVLTEELDKALSCFRNAIRVDPRRYNAWYGLGMIYYKQEKFALAEMHFRKALSINPQSSVLLCHIGVVQHALQKSDGALATLNKAVALDPKNPLCKFHRASILFANDKHKEALKELEELKVIVPKESLVYFLIGKVHKKLGNMHLAMMNFSWAMDLDPKGANNQIKEAIDKRYVTDDDDAYDVFGPREDLEGIDIQEIDSPGDGESSHNTSLMDSDDVQLRALESDESL
ncbi:cell division cycle protein 27 homolog [Tubulanus polymorphus]|uniref:cell division cycle protein 27 homolog n=1 Tax=Tubulanus polymorphus TaxID=672921 RepID=UPI003DA5D72D